MECFKELNMFAMKQPRKLSNQESQRFENFRIQAPKSKGWENFKTIRYPFLKVNQTKEITFQLVAFKNIHEPDFVFDLSQSCWIRWCSQIWSLIGVLRYWFYFWKLPLNSIKICSYNVKYIVKAMLLRLENHNLLLTTEMKSVNYTCTLYKYALDIKFENLFSFAEFTVWAYSDLMWY